MKFALVSVSVWLAVCHGYVVAPPLSTHSSSSSSWLTGNLQRRMLYSLPSQLLASTNFMSDFASAMPEKPEVSMEERINQSADEFILNMESVLGEATDPPPELQALKNARQELASVEEITLRVYELMIERGMRYDQTPEGVLVPTDFDIPSNLDIPEVRKEFAHLYQYGMMLMNRGLLSADQVKKTVIERLIKRTGLTPEKFDEWLGY